MTEFGVLFNTKNGLNAWNEINPDCDVN